MSVQDAGEFIRETDRRVPQAVAAHVEADGPRAVRQQEPLSPARGDEPCQGVELREVERIRLRSGSPGDRRQHPRMGGGDPHRPCLGCGEIGMLESVQVPRKSARIFDPKIDVAAVERAPCRAAIVRTAPKPFPGETGAPDPKQGRIGGRSVQSETPKRLDPARRDTSPGLQPAMQPRWVGCSAMRPTTAETRSSSYSPIGRTCARGPARRRAIRQPAAVRSRRLRLAPAPPDRRASPGIARPKHRGWHRETRP